jgi:hypothetical protein
MMRKWLAIVALFLQIMTCYTSLHLSRTASDAYREINRQKRAGGWIVNTFPFGGRHGIPTLYGALNIADL